MIDLIQSNETIIWWLVATSAFTFFASLILVPIIVVRIPADYFVYKKRHPTPPVRYPPLLRIVVLIIKNVIGLILFCAGVIMIFFPGQGLFTMFIGMMMMNFPGKYKLERWIVDRGPVMKSINWLRRRAGHEPLLMHDDPIAGDGRTAVTDSRNKLG
jgi:hypothetical protein